MTEETVTFNLELNVEQTVSELRRVEGLLFRSLGLLRRLSGNEDINAAISKIQRLVLVIRLAHSAIIALQAASGPLGWAWAITGMGAAALTAGDVIVEMNSR